MHRKILVAALAALIVAAGVATASAAPKKQPHRYAPKGNHCRKGYRRVHKRHRKLFCVKETVKAATKKPLTAASKVKLHAHLDPTFTRDPLDPFKVTYAYSASATQEPVATTQSAASTSSETPAQLPSGVLALYSDGKLECAVNVGSGVEGSECPVNYQALGEHRVTTIYTSGEQSATEAEVEHIEPLATTTTLSVRYEPLTTTRSDFGCGADSTCSQELGFSENGGFEIGTLTIEGNAQPWNEAPISACVGTDAKCSTVSLGAGGLKSFPVTVIANYVSLEEKSLAVGETLAITPEAVKSVRIAGLGLSEIPPDEIEEGSYGFHVISPLHPGYQSSAASAPIQFAPKVSNQVERIPMD